MKRVLEEDLGCHPTGRDWMRPLVVVDKNVDVCVKGL